MNGRTLTAIGAGAAVIAVLGWLSMREPPPPREHRATWTGPDAAEPTPSRDPVRPASISNGSADGAPTAFIQARWGAKRGELGRERPQEGNPEGPSSLAFVGTDLVILDQVNARAVRYDARGNVVSVSDAPATAQEIAIAPDGTMAMLDRLATKTITLTDPSGRKIGSLPLEGETGLLTGVFFDGKDVYVEKEHGALEKVGTTDGKPAAEKRELAGRPTRDGELLLTATLAQGAQGKVTLNAFDRKKDALRFARIVQVAAPARSIVLLDSDAKGTLYLGVFAGEPEAVHIACLEPVEGKVIGRAILPTSDSPEETFRDVTISADGLIAYAVRTDEGASYQTARCAP